MKMLHSLLVFNTLTAQCNVKSLMPITAKRGDAKGLVDQHRAVLLDTNIHELMVGISAL